MSEPAREQADAQEAERERAEQALARAAEVGIHRLAIPTPFQVGRVNAYLIEDEPLTLIDSGPNSAEMRLSFSAISWRASSQEIGLKRA